MWSKIESSVYLLVEARRFLACTVADFGWEDADAVVSPGDEEQSKSSYGGGAYL